jgi:hypothetical protein
MVNLSILKRMITSVALTALAAFGFGVAAVQSVAAADRPDPELAKAAKYCTKTGGTVLTGVPYYGTNGGDPLRLAGSAGFCQYTSQKDGSQIYVLLSTLYATRPSLAATAYYAKVQSGQCNGNPASCYCTLLGGSDEFGGINAAGGGWVFNADFTNVLEACIFPDLSSIDSWGLLYHSAGIIRGKNLGTVLRYKNP